MMLTPQQVAALENIGKTTDGRTLREILDCYILELKDQVLDETLEPKVGKAAILKLAELRNKMAVLAGEKPDPASKDKFV